MPDAYFKGEPELAKLMGIIMPSQWTIFGEGPFQWTYKEPNDPRNKQWLSYMPVLKEKRMLIGNCGFKGYPKDGMVEIGYEVAIDYRGSYISKKIFIVMIAAGYHWISRFLFLSLPNCSKKVQPAQRLFLFHS